MIDTTHARLSNGNIVEAYRGMLREQTFFCLGCGEKLYAAIGEENKAHFRHYSLKKKKGCNPESYVHRVTKELFAEHYKQCEKFFLSIAVKQKCYHNTCNYIGEYIINLKDIYPLISVEKFYMGFRPDCLLFNESKEKVLFFEVLYTHPVSNEKIDTGHPIIEASIQTSEDINNICKVGGFNTKEKSSEFPHLNSKNYYKIILHNSKNLIPQSARLFDCQDKCIIEKKEAEERLKKQRERAEKIKKEQGIKQIVVSSVKEKEARAFSLTNSTSINNNDAIEHLSNATGKHTAYAKDIEITAVIGKSLSYYMSSLDRHKDKELIYNEVYILENSDYFMFIAYNDEYYGAIKYEAIWHVFTIKKTSNNQSVPAFIESTNNGNSVLDIIRTVSDIF